MSASVAPRSEAGSATTRSSHAHDDSILRGAQILRTQLMELTQKNQQGDNDNLYFSPQEQAQIVQGAKQRLSQSRRQPPSMIETTSSVVHHKTSNDDTMVSRLTSSFVSSCTSGRDQPQTTTTTTFLNHSLDETVFSDPWQQPQNTAPPPKLQFHPHSHAEMEDHLRLEDLAFSSSKMKDDPNHWYYACNSNNVSGYSSHSSGSSTPEAVDPEDDDLFLTPSSLTSFQQKKKQATRITPSFDDDRSHVSEQRALDSIRRYESSVSVSTGQQQRLRSSSLCGSGASYRTYSSQSKLSNSRQSSLRKAPTAILVEPQPCKHESNKENEPPFTKMSAASFTPSASILQRYAPTAVSSTNTTETTTPVKSGAVTQSTISANSTTGRGGVFDPKKNRSATERSVITEEEDEEEDEVLLFRPISGRDQARQAADRQQRPQRFRLKATYPHVLSPLSNEYQALSTTNPAYVHAQRAGKLWQSLVAQHVRFPSEWGMTCPSKSIPWKYLSRHRVQGNAILNSLVPEPVSSGRLLLHVIVRDSLTLEPVQELALGTFYPQSKSEQEDECRDVWLAVRSATSTSTATSTSSISMLDVLLDPPGVSTLRHFNDTTSNSPLMDRTTPVSNEHLRNVFGQTPPLATMMLLEQELYDTLVTLIQERRMPPALAMLQQLFVPHHVNVMENDHDAGEEYSEI